MMHFPIQRKFGVLNPLTKHRIRNVLWFLNFLCNSGFFTLLQPLSTKAELVESAQLGFEECRATLNKNCDEDLCALDYF